MTKENHSYTGQRDVLETAAHTQIPVLFFSTYSLHNQTQEHGPTEGSSSPANSGDLRTNEW